MEKNLNKKFSSIDEYLEFLPAELTAKAKEMRRIIKEAAPAATELISYNMPAFKLNSVLVWFAVYKNHIGLYPKSAAIRNFKEELADYKTSKGAIQFPIEKAIPKTLLKKIVKYRIQEDRDEAALKIKKKK